MLFVDGKIAKQFFCLASVASTLDLGCSVSVLQI